ncbi:MAG: hypothetical protein ACLGH0_05015, partial [Thermoanaerobaculia bacterium]
MPAIALYALVSLGLIFVWHRFVQPLRVWTALVLVLLPFCFTGRALLTGRVYGPIDLPYMSEPLKDYAVERGLEKIDDKVHVYNGTLSDLYMQMIPWQSAVRKSYAAGEWPLWNPYMLCGNLLAANMQSAPYDPLQTLGMLLSHPQALTFVAAMTFFFAGLFTYGFARSLGCSELAALFAAAAYMFCQILAFFVAWPLGRSWAIFPLMMLGVRLVVRETNVRAAVILTTAFVLLLVAGHPESVLHIVAVGAIYGAFETLRAKRWKAIALATICGVIALGLTAIALLPFFEAAPHTSEYMIRHIFYKVHPLPYDSTAVAKRAGLSLFAWYGGQPERDNHTNLWEPTNVRTGTLPLLLAIAALFVARKRAETWFFFTLAVLCAWIGLNAWPFADWLHKVPAFDITINDRLSFAAAFGIAMLAGFAIDAWDRRVTWLFALGAVVIAIAAALLRDTSLAAGVKPELVTLLTITAIAPLVLAALAARSRY